MSNVGHRGANNFCHLVLILRFYDVALIYIFFVVLLCLPSDLAAAGTTNPLSNRVPANTDSQCASPPDRAIAVMCAISKRYGVPVVKVGSAQFIASLEATAVHCDFTPTKKLGEFRDLMLKDSEISRIYPTLRQAVMTSPPSNLGSFCRTAYSMMGPSAGHDKQMFR